MEKGLLKMYPEDMMAAKVACMRDIPPNSFMIIVSRGCDGRECSISERYSYLANFALTNLMLNLQELDI